MDRFDTPLHKALLKLFPDNEGITADKNGFKISGFGSGISCYYDTHKIFSLATKDTWTLREFCKLQGVNNDLVDEVAEEFAVNVDGKKGYKKTEIKGSSKNVKAELKHLSDVGEHDYVHKYLQHTRGFKLSVDNYPSSIKQGLYQAEVCMAGIFTNKFDNITGIAFTKLEMDNQNRVHKFNDDNDDCRISIGTRKESAIVIQDNPDSDSLIICEGIEDGLSLLQGVEEEINICCVFGADYFNARIPDHIKTVYLAHDNDPSGNENVDKFCDEFPYLEVNTFTPPHPHKDFGDVMQNDIEEDVYNLSNAKCIQDYDAEGVPIKQRKIVWKNDLLMNHVVQETKYLIEGLLPESGLGSLHALPKEGKSLIANHAIGQIILGGKTLGKQCKQGGVFLYDAEPDINRVCFRFQKQFGDNWKELLGVNKDEKGWLRYSNDVMDYRILIRKMREDVLKYRPALIVFDTLPDFLPKMKSKSLNYEEEAGRKRQLRNFATKYNFFILGINHDNQTGHSDSRLRQQGTSGEIAKEDVLIGFEKETLESKEGTLSVVGKDIASRKDVLKLNEDKFIWEYVGEKADVDYKSTKEIVIDSINRLIHTKSAKKITYKDKEVRATTPKQVATVYELDLKTVQTCMERLHDDEKSQIIRVDRGCYTTHAETMENY